MSMYQPSSTSSSFPGSSATASGGGGSIAAAAGSAYGNPAQPPPTYPPRGGGFGGGMGGASASGTSASASSASGLLDQGKIFVGGLSWQTTEESLLFHFQQYGAVASVELMKDRNTGKPRGFGFVCFEDPATVDLVMQESHEVCHKVVDVKRAQARGVAPPSIHQDRQQQQLQQFSQPPPPAMMGPSPSGPPSEAGSLQGTDAASQSSQQPPPPPSFFGGGGPKPRLGFGGPQHDTMTPEQLHCKVFVGGIPHSVDRDELRRLMSEFGTVVDSIIMLDQVTMRSRGFGFITFSDAAAAERSISAQPINIQGKMVEIKLATPRPDRAGGDPAAFAAAPKPFSPTTGFAGGGPPLNSGPYGPPYNNHHRASAYPNRFLGLRAGQVASNSEFAGFAVAYGRSGWKAGFGSRAFGRHGWNVQGWDDDEHDDDDDHDNDEAAGAKQPASAGFSFAMHHDDENEGDQDRSPPSKRVRLSSPE